MNRNTRVFIGVTIILLSVARLWNVKQQQKDRNKQQQMIRDLSNQQLEERIEREKNLVITIPSIDLDSMKRELDAIGDNLDSIGKNLERLNGSK